MTKSKSNKKADAKGADKNDQKVNLAPLLGAATALMMESPLHQHLFMADMKWLLVPPLQLQQFRIFKKGDVPVAFVSWAYLDAEVEGRMAKGQLRLRPDEWNRGKNAWVIDLVAPFGGHEQILKTLKKETFKGEHVQLMRASSSGVSPQSLD